MSTTVGAFIAGGLAACGAVTVTHGFETVKIRLQLQGELQSKAEAPRLYKGVLHGVGVILKNEGVPGLFRGIGSAQLNNNNNNNNNNGDKYSIFTKRSSTAVDSDSTSHSARPLPPLSTKIPLVNH
ncbi:MAG: Mitochondrial oxaloacetate carrier protein [Watsoniomyces obsoletus]|nr:MAG: Mitochondrial oxaloacetate carrier protein [Watsoniomyces obsoletus]